MILYKLGLYFNNQMVITCIFAAKIST